MMNIKRILLTGFVMVTLSGNTTANDAARDMILNGAKVDGTAKVTSNGAGAELSIAAGDNMPVTFYSPQSVPIYQEGSSLTLRPNSAQEPIGKTYYLPWSEGEATIMILPDEAGAATTFVTPRLDGCGVAIGKNADGQAVVMHLNFVETQEIKQAEDAFIDAAVEKIDNPTTENIARVNETFQSKMELISNQYREAIIDALIDKKYFSELWGTIVPDGYRIGSVGSDGLTQAQEAYVTGTFESDGWTFRAAIGTRFPTGEQPEVLAEGIERSTNINDNTEPFSEDGESTAGSEVDWYDAREAESVVSEAFFDAQQSLSDLSSISEQEQGVRVSEALDVINEAERIFGERILPDDVDSERTSLLQSLDNEGIEYGSTVSNQIVEDFQQVAEHDSTIAGLFAEGGAAQTAFRYAGRTFLVAGIGVSIYKVVASDNHALEAAKQGGGWAGAIAAGTAASAGAAWLDFTGPYGWIADGAIGVGAGILGFWGGSTLGEHIYISTHPTNTDPLPDALRNLRAIKSLPSSDAEHSDGLVFQKTDGQVFFQSLVNTNPHGGVYIYRPVDSDWHLKGVGDVNGDGTDDIIWQHNNGIHYWSMQNGVRQGGYDIYSGTLNAGWLVKGVGDVDGDGTDDIIWQHNNGQVYYWPMQNGERQGGFSIDSGTTGSLVKGVGDIDGDGTDDIILQDSGRVHYWPMQNGVRQDGYDIGALSNGWHIRGVGDIDGDGTDDIITQYNNGWVYYSAMQNGSVNGSGAIDDSSDNWELLGVGNLYGSNN
jgi:hypothetical protein